MSQSYVKDCIFCKSKIRMSDQMGKWLPYNHDDSTHKSKAKERERHICTSPFEETSSYRCYNRPGEIEECKMKKRTHCESCGEWLEGYKTCSECGRINK